MNQTHTEKRYPDLHQDGILRKRAEAAAEILRDCTLCPHACHVDRTAGERGVCRTGDTLVVSSFSPHYGEEEPLVGKRGSGTIFFTHCNLACVYCQNHDISKEGRGYEISADDLAMIMLRLQEMGCHNINLVSPTHQVAGILEAIDIAAGHGLTIPIVYNTGGYDAVTTLELLDGVIDIYMPDAKYGDDEIANDLSGAPDYVEKMHDALKEMHRQVGDLVIRDGIAKRGMIIRHLVLPDDLSGTRAVVAFIAEEISTNTYTNIMPQYRPAFRVGRLDQRYQSLQRRITGKEYEDAIRSAGAAGLRRGINTKIE